MKPWTPVFFIFIIFFCNCSNSVEPQDLYGRWNYIKVDNSNPKDSLSAAEIGLQKPAIIFSPNNDLVIEWGGKSLSHGKFRMEGKMVRYTEFLDGGRKREFPFLIKKLSKEELVFVTMEQNFTRVTARR